MLYCMSLPNHSRAAALVHIRRNILGITQEQFAGILNVEQSTVSRWENGKAEPSHSELEVISGLAREKSADWDDRWLFVPPEPAPAPGSETAA